MSESPAPALKDWFDEARYRSVAAQLVDFHPRFDRKRFLARALDGLDELSLMQRLRRMTEATREALPLGYRDSLAVLRELAPRIDHPFVPLFLPDFVGIYGRDDFDESMAALNYFTRFGSAEFAVREFLRDDLPRALATMRKWSADPDEHVRRLASEGCRPRLPWSFRLAELVADPRPVLPILEKLKADPSLYVRKSVANHLNDISRDHPDITLEILSAWDRGHPRTAWIAKRALRTLIKQGHPEALTLLGAGEPAQVEIERFSVAPGLLALGGQICLSLALVSIAQRPQRLLLDYAIRYVKKDGGSSEKVFKWTARDLGSGETLVLEKRQTIKDFTTRKHYPGRHFVSLTINGERLAESRFDLSV